MKLRNLITHPSTAADEDTPPSSAPEPLPAADPEAAAAGEDQPAFDWARNWYPVALESNLSTDRPNAIQLLGKQIAVWRDGAGGAWHAVEDRCPHRRAFAPEALRPRCRPTPLGRHRCNAKCWFNGIFDRLRSLSITLGISPRRGRRLLRVYQ